MERQLNSVDIHSQTKFIQRGRSLGLNDNHIQFCLNYTTNGNNASKAYKQVYNTTNSTHSSVSGYKLLQKSKIKEYVDYLHNLYSNNSSNIYPYKGCNTDSNSIQDTGNILQIDQYNVDKAVLSLAGKTDGQLQLKVIQYIQELQSKQVDNIKSIVIRLPHKKPELAPVTEINPEDIKNPEARMQRYLDQDTKNSTTVPSRTEGVGMVDGMYPTSHIQQKKQEEPMCNTTGSVLHETNTGAYTSLSDAMKGGSR